MENKPLEILLIDDEDIVGKRLRPSLEKAGYRVEVLTKGSEAIERLRQKAFDIVATDVRIDEVDGLEVLAAVRAKSSHTKTIIITGYASLELAREAGSKGAFDLELQQARRFEKNFLFYGTNLPEAIEHVERARRLARENQPMLEGVMGPNGVAVLSEHLERYGTALAALEHSKQESGENQVREHGAALLDAAQRLVEGERKLVH